MRVDIEEIKKWNEKIEEKVKEFNLDVYPQEFEVIGYKEMIANEAYIGMPSKYPHWSYGKAYDKKKSLYDVNIIGLPYEMVINSNPCIAYLMRENNMSLQILTMAHVYGHNDFFKNNRMFKTTVAEDVISMFKRNSDVIRGYIEDVNIGYEKVERVLDAAHGIKFQIALDEEEDIFEYLIKKTNLLDYEKTILRIVKKESLYFLPQIETKIMNEGWASFWHYKILKSLNLDFKDYIEFLKNHNQVVSPIVRGINPYYIGFKIFMDIEKRFGIEKAFEARALERDSSFLRKYLTKDLVNSLKLYKFGKKSFEFVVEEVGDEEGYKEIINKFSNNVGCGNIPSIKVEAFEEENNCLVLRHVFGGKELDIFNAKETLKKLNKLTNLNIRLITKSRDFKEININCQKDDKIFID